jgi:glycosyltransferase involved in cell wall biosynthesis
MSIRVGAAPGVDLKPASPPRVAIASVGDPASSKTWSGVTAGVFSAMDELGVATTGLDLRLPRGLEQALLVGASARTLNRRDAHGAAPTMSVRSRLAGRRVAARKLDGVVQIGSNFILPRGVNYVTLEDMTLRQASAIHPVFSQMSASGISGWEQRRARIYERARMCAVASHWAAESLIVEYGLPRAKVAVVGFGATHRALVSERAWSPPRFLFVGIDWERKGGPLLLRAFARVRELLPQATLDIVGGHPPIEQAGVNAHGALLQSRAEHRQLMLELFARATCLVVPSLVEPFGIVYVEAGSSGIPSIVSGEGGARDTIGPDGGAVIAPGDEDGLLEAMLQLADPKTARRMGDAARERAALYSWTKVAERLLRALDLQAPDGRRLAEFL